VFTRCESKVIQTFSKAQFRHLTIDGESFKAPKQILALPGLRQISFEKFPLPANGAIRLSGKLF
jgi:hypothetical protein